jgi:hypothetical protein
MLKQNQGIVFQLFTEYVAREFATAEEEEP